MEAAERGQDLPADQAPQGFVVRRVDAEVEALGPAVGLRLVAPHHQERPDDAVLARRADSGGRPARGEPVEDGLDLVGGGVPGGAKPVSRERVAKVPELFLGASVQRRGLDDIGSETLTAVPRVLLGLGPAELMVDVERADAVAEGPKRMPEACRVRAT